MCRSHYKGALANRPVSIRLVDPEPAWATAEPVVTNRFLAKQLAKHGLAFPVGHCPCVPLSGFILSGGLGWNAGEWGISCFSLLSVDVVTADGSLVTASETENTELLWAARGAGPGFFGVATKYRVRLYPLPRAITTSTLMYPLGKLPEVVEWATETATRCPRMWNSHMYLASLRVYCGPIREGLHYVRHRVRRFGRRGHRGTLALATCPLEDV